MRIITERNAQLIEEVMQEEITELKTEVLRAYEYKTK